MRGHCGAGSGPSPLTVIDTPSSRCGAAASSASSTGLEMSIGGPESSEGADSLPRIARQRSTDSSSRLKIVGERLVVRRLGGHFPDDQRDGGERRPQFVRGGGGEPVELREMLGARQNEFRRGQRARRLPRLGRHPVGVERHESGADPESKPDAGHVKGRKDELLAADPGERQVEAQERGRAGERKREQAERPTKRQRGRGDGDGGEKQDDERIGDPSGQEQQPRQLKNVVGEKNGRVAFAEPRADRKQPSQRQVERGRRRDQPETGERGEAKAEAEDADQDRSGLPGDGEPAQTDEGIEPQTTGLETETFRLRRQKRRSQYEGSRGPGGDHSIFSLG